MENVSSAAGIADRPTDYVDTSPRGLAGLTRDALRVALSSPLLFLVVPMLLYFPFEWGANVVAATKTGALAQLNSYLYVYRLVEFFLGSFITALVVLGAKTMLETGAKPTLGAAFGAAGSRYGAFLHTTWSMG